MQTLTARIPIVAAAFTIALFATPAFADKSKPTIKSNTSLTGPKLNAPKAKKKALQARKDHHEAKKERARAYRKKHKYNRVPEGIFIYRLDTATLTLSLMSEPHSQTDLTKLVAEMAIASARPLG